MRIKVAKNPKAELLNRQLFLSKAKQPIGFGHVDRIVSQGTSVFFRCHGYDGSSGIALTIANKTTGIGAQKTRETTVEELTNELNKVPSNSVVIRGMINNASDDTLEKVIDDAAGANLGEIVKALRAAKDIESLKRVIRIVNEKGCEGTLFEAVNTKDIRRIIDVASGMAKNIFLAIIKCATYRVKKEQIMKFVGNKISKKQLNKTLEGTQVIF